MKNKITFILLFQFLLLLPFYGYSQANMVNVNNDGDIDLTFNTPVHVNPPDANGFIDSSNNPANIYTIKILSSGKMVVYGDFNKYQGITVNKLARLNADGSLDTTFNVGSGPNTSFFNFQGYSALIDEQSDGKIIVGGIFSSFNGVAKSSIVRLNLDGSVDTTFTATTSSSGGVYCVKVLSDGKILCGGAFITFNGVSQRGLVRLNTNGTTDTAFNVLGGFTRYANSFAEEPSISTLAVQDDGKILVGGIFQKYDTVSKINIIRLNTDGSHDSTFNIGLGAGTNLQDSGPSHITKIIYDSNLDKIYITGTIITFNGVTTKNVLRLNLNGSIDSSFNFTTDVGYYDHGSIFDLNLLPDGKLLLGGAFGPYSATNTITKCLLLFGQNGVIDPSFNFLTNDTVYCIASSNAMIMVGGYFAIANYPLNYKASIVKIHESGLTDISFNPNLGGTANGGICHASLSLHDGKIITTLSKNITIAATNGNNDAALYNERIVTGLTKINYDGSLDMTYYTNFNSLDTYGMPISYDLSNGILASYTVTKKITESGTFDPAFTSTTAIIASAPVNVNVWSYAQVVQPNGKVIIGGNFKITPNVRQRIMRINSNGSLDGSFNVGTGFNGSAVAGDEGYAVTTVALQADGKVLAGGKFTDYNSNAVTNIARINSDGSYDATFVTGTGFNGEVKKIVYLSSGKILVSGLFTTYNGTNAAYIIRLNSNGTVDTAFTSPYTALATTTRSRVSNILLQPDGKCLVSGRLSSVSFLNRLNTDGTLDATFNNNHTFVMSSGSWNNDLDLIYSMTFDQQNRILLSGNFKKIDNVRRVGIARLHNDSVLSVPGNDLDETKISLTPNPVKDELTINAVTVAEKAEVFNINGALVRSYKLTNNKADVSDLAKGIYLVKVYFGNKTISSKIVKY